MARPARSQLAAVLIGLEVSGLDVARIDQVLARPEFTGWTREQWCYEIIQTALRYYVGDAGGVPPSSPRPRRSPEPPPPAPEPPPLARQPPPPEPSPPDPEPLADADPACPHPADARDYQTGTCAACGAILWD